jgi:hypothetical protein
VHMVPEHILPRSCSTPDPLTDGGAECVSHVIGADACGLRKGRRVAHRSQGPCLGSFLLLRTGAHRPARGSAEPHAGGRHGGACDRGGGGGGAAARGALLAAVGMACHQPSSNRRLASPYATKRARKMEQTKIQVNSLQHQCMGSGWAAQRVLER